MVNNDYTLSNDYVKCTAHLRASFIFDSKLPFGSSPPIYVFNARNKIEIRGNACVFLKKGCNCVVKIRDNAHLKTLYSADIVICETMGKLDLPDDFDEIFYSLDNEIADHFENGRVM